MVLVCDINKIYKALLAGGKKLDAFEMKKEIKALGDKYERLLIE